MKNLKYRKPTVSKIVTIQIPVSDSVLQTLIKKYKIKYKFEKINILNDKKISSKRYFQSGNFNYVNNFQMKIKKKSKEVYIDSNDVTHEIYDRSHIIIKFERVEEI